MENVRHRVVTTTRRSKGSNQETTVPAVNTVASSRQAPSAGDSENYHPGRRQRSRRRDVHVAPDDFVRVSPPATTVSDAVRHQVNSSDVHAKSPQFWAQPVFTSGDRTETRSRSRPRPPFLLERGVQRGEMSGEYVRNAVDNGRLQEQQLTNDSYHRPRYHQRQQQQQQNHAVALKNPSVEFAARCAVDCRPQIRPNPTSMLPSRTVTSPTPASLSSPPTSLSPPHLNDNKTLLKEALISAAAAKLARSSSARSAVVKPLVVVRNGPSKSSSDEHVDADAMTTMTTVNSPLSGDGPESLAATVEAPEHTADVAVATAAAVAAAATRRLKTRRPDADQTTSSGVTASSAVSGTSLADNARTQRTRALNRDAAAGNQVSQSKAAASSVSGIKTQDSVTFRGTRTVDSGALPNAAGQTSPSYNCDHADDSRRAAALFTAPADTSNVSETSSKTNSKKTASVTSDNRKDLRQPTSDKARRDCEIQRGVKTVSDNNITGHETTSVGADTQTCQEFPSAKSGVSFVKTILSRTRSPSPTRGRRSRSKGKALHTSPRPSSIKRLGAEVAQRIGEPVKGYLKHLRDRSSQRRRPAESATDSAVKTTDEAEPTACQDNELASTVHSQTRPSDESPSAVQATSCDNRSTEDMPSRGRRRFRTDRDKQDNESSALTSQWKSTSELTTPMSRLDNLLKANSLQHLQTSRKNKAPVDDSGAGSTSSSTSSRLPLLGKTSQSAGCLLPSESQRQQSVERQRATTMSRCYLEKPPRTARRAMTVQLDRQQTPSLSVKKRQSTSQADLRNPQPVGEEPADSSKSTKDDDNSKQSTDGATAATAATSTRNSLRQLRSGNHTSSSSSSQNERDLRELYEQKRLERQLEEKLAVMEKQRADMIARLWSQIDHPRETNTTTRPRTPVVSDHLRDSSSSSGLVLPLSYSRTSSAENNNQMVSDPLGDLLIELSSTPATARWIERRRAGRTTTATLRPRAASCSRRLMSDTPAAAAAAAATALTSKSQSHTQLHRNPSNCSDLGRADSSHVHLRHRSHQQLQPKPSSSNSRPLTCYLPVRDRDLDLRRFIETSGHRVDQCGHVQLTASTCHGFLTKSSAGATVKQWKRRWFVFDRAQRCLQYYPDKTEKSADGVFIWFQTIQDVFVDHERRSHSPRPESTFCVKTVERPLFLIAPTPETMRIWIDVIFTGAEGYQQFV